MGMIWSLLRNPSVPAGSGAHFPHPEMMCIWPRPTMRSRRCGRFEAAPWALRDDPCHLSAGAAIWAADGRRVDLCRITAGCRLVRRLTSMGARVLRDVLPTRMVILEKA